jgi:hypothetical protein
MKGFTIYQRRIIFTGYIFLVIISLLSAQTRNNPFEIKPRLQNLPLNDTLKSQIKNPSEQNDTLASPQPINNQQSLKPAIKPSSSSTEENPFEIDHVPLRKTALTAKGDDSTGITESTRTPNGFLFWFLLLGCSILAIVLNLKSKSPGLIYRSMLNENMLKLFYREESTKFSSYLFLLYCVFCINLAVFLYLASSYYDGPDGVYVFLAILAGVIVLYITRHLSLNLLGNVFGLNKYTDLYSFAIMVFNLFAGLILIPLNFLIAFGPDYLQEIILIISFNILGVLVLLRTIRGIFIVSEHLIGRIFQIFIYLCAFEIAPVLILIKTVMNLGQ